MARKRNRASTRGTPMSLPTVERLEACMRSTQSLLADLDAADWSVPSLCPGWTVR
ncbi:MAG: hypothetical protein F2812_16895, partial [Actinobacteria bacterium]|nr:hypothetical protein [Actinomycetota bacterium]MSW93262.1 hypothetical protein [Actinomycetota bacterium]